MLVKIGNTYHDSDKEPIMLILDEDDKELISNMGDQKQYCRFPEGCKQECIENFMEIKR